MIKEIHITEIREISELILEQELDSRTGRYRSSYLYRGLPNIDFRLETSLFRNCKSKQKNIEKSILRNSQNMLQQKIHN